MYRVKCDVYLVVCLPICLFAVLLILNDAVHINLFSIFRAFAVLRGIITIIIIIII